MITTTEIIVSFAAMFAILFISIWEMEKTKKENARLKKECEELSAALEYSTKFAQKVINESVEDMEDMFVQSMEIMKTLIENGAA